MGLVWVCLSRFYLLVKLGLGNGNVVDFFFFFWELYMRFRELGWFICVKEFLDFFMFLEFNVGLIENAN